jgi:hypothetical protein
MIHDLLRMDATDRGSRRPGTPGKGSSGVLACRFPFPVNEDVDTLSFFE